MKNKNDHTVGIKYNIIDHLIKRSFTTMLSSYQDWAAQTSIKFKSQKRAVCTKFDIYIFIISLDRYQYWWTISPGGYHPSSSQCFSIIHPVVSVSVSSIQ